ncbi:TIGR02206 family membrane protein [Fredinandcohnia sp. SECRCQ15]|uniref:TIGR02206 family membrane protein n=2 Tax=Fredinandcohnia quinoae TaxID=2918902 RepID=A0AAW5E323_9BACI|nr:TIGR02206 family membrane protein [Fredinandcohnia sp. SECRCQ15]
MLCLFVGMAVILFVFRTKFSGRKFVIRYTLACFLLLSELSLYAWYTYTKTWDIVDTLPLQLCSISLILSFFMLLSRNKFLFEVTYFLGIGGALQAMLTPELSYDFPHYRYFHFFIAHIAIILASLYMIWYEGYKPTIKSILKAFATLNIIAIFVFLMNKATGGNYMFLAHKPNNPSLIDFLGPYPWYILSLEIVALVMFFLLYLPFSIKKSN